MYLTVCKYNANMTPTKMGTFSQYKYPCGMERYAELAEYCGLGGATVEESYENWLKAGADLKAEIDIPETIQDWGVDEKAFLAVVDNMAERAFHAACTGCNPCIRPSVADRLAGAGRRGLGVESFSYFLQETPGMYYDLGSGVGTGLHTATFCADEAVLLPGIALQCESVLAL